MEPAHRGPLSSSAGGEQPPIGSGRSAARHNCRRNDRGVGLRRESLVSIHLPNGPRPTGGHSRTLSPWDHCPCEQQFTHHAVDVPHHLQRRSRTKRLRGLPEELYGYRCGTVVLGKPSRQTWIGLGLELLFGTDHWLFSLAALGRKRRSRQCPQPAVSNISRSQADRVSRRTQPFCIDLRWHTSADRTSTRALRQPPRTIRAITAGPAAHASARHIPSGQYLFLLQCPIAGSARRAWRHHVAL